MIDQLKQGAVVGTSSPRRAAQVRRLRPDIRIVPIRGNVETRLKKVEERRSGCDLARLGRAETARHRRRYRNPDRDHPARARARP